MLSGTTPPPPPRWEAPKNLLRLVSGFLLRRPAHFLSLFVSVLLVLLAGTMVSHFALTCMVRFDDMEQLAIAPLVARHEHDEWACSAHSSSYPLHQVGPPRGHPGNTGVLPVRRFLQINASYAGRGRPSLSG